MRTIVNRMGVGAVEERNVGVAGLLRPVLLVIALSLVVSSCAPRLVQVADESKAEEWGRCQPRSQPVGANILCFQLRQPL